MHKPVLGYPSLTAACEALADQGLEAYEIAQKVNRTPARVQRLLAAGKKRCGDRKILLTRDSISSLQDEAARRALSVDVLATELLERICEDDLFDALLGEADG